MDKQSKYNKYKFYLAILFIVLGLLGAAFTYTLHDDYDSESTFFASGYGEEYKYVPFDGGTKRGEGTWYRGGVAIDSAKDGVAAGLGVFSGFLILSGTLLIIKID